MAQTLAHQLLRCQLAGRLAVEENLPALEFTVFQRQQTRNSLERGGLAGPVAAQQGHDLPARHSQRQATQGLHHLVVDDLDVVHLKDVVRCSDSHNLERGVFSPGHPRNRLCRSAGCVPLPRAARERGEGAKRLRGVFHLTVLSSRRPAPSSAPSCRPCRPVPPGWSCP